MNSLLIFFAIPVATIIFSIVLQKLLNNPLLVSATFFAIFLLVTFSVFDASFLVCTILYTLLSLLTALLLRIFCCIIKNNINTYCNENILQGSGICPVEIEEDSNNNCNCNCNCSCNRDYRTRYYSRKC